MKNHNVSITEAQDGFEFEFSDVFNVAVSFIDRHLTEGRADKIAIRTTSGEEVTYGELAANVNRCGNFFKSSGLTKGNRLIMVVKDCPEFFYIFWGSIKAGIIPIPINTLLRAKDYRFIIDNSECSAVLYSPEYKSEIEPALKMAQNSPALSISIQGEEKDLVQLIQKSPADLEAADRKSVV